MSSIMIRELAPGSAIDRKAMSAIRGGTNSWLGGLGPVANVSVGVSQNITQNQIVEVNAFNNIGYIGSGVGPFKLTVDPSQYANAAVNLF
jgi:hypothetical protein